MLMAPVDSPNAVTRAPPNPTMFFPEPAQRAYLIEQSAVHDESVPRRSGNRRRRAGS